MMDRPKRMTRHELVITLENMLSTVRNGATRGGLIEYKAIDRDRPESTDFNVTALWQVGPEGGVLRIAD